MYCAGNPIKYIDPSGKFKISVQDAKISPALNLYLKRGISKVLENPKIVKALMKNGEFTREQLNEDFMYGKGPIIQLDPYIDYYGLFVPKEGSDELKIKMDAYGVEVTEYNMEIII